MIRIDIFADVVCPWCYIGEKRLQAALDQRPDLQVERHWQPFQLRPDMPVEGEDWETFVNEKFGGMERAGQMFENVVQAGADSGIEFRFDRMTRSPNTVNAHRLILLAAGQGIEWEMVHKLFEEHFTEGTNLSDADSLVEAAVELGLDADLVREFLDGAEGQAEVFESQQVAEQLGISGVPFFIFDSRLAVSGAQPAEVFQQVLDRVISENAAAD
jgi:predicted DsbA family dithiol-disulfide isomerase